jgi:hypothetical protein
MLVSSGPPLSQTHKALFRKTYFCYQHISQPLREAILGATGAEELEGALPKEYPT